MIKFFRNIRQNLIMENKTSKYLKYAIGEIVLVMIGILLALQVNNWNENRKQLIQQEFLLKQLLVDAEVDLKFFTSRFEALSMLDSTLNIIRLFGDEPEYDIATINTNGSGNVFYNRYYLFESSLLNNNPDAYKELLSFEIKSILRNINSKYSYLNASFTYLNNELKQQSDKFSKRYYKELRQNKATKSIEALRFIYRDEEMQSVIDVLKRAIAAALKRTKEYLEINEELIKALNIKLNNND